MRKFLKIIKILCFMAGVVIIADAIIVLGYANTTSNIKTSDAIIVMGAAINSPALYNRTLKALELYEAGKAPLLILSGGKISEADITEAVYMQRVLQANAKQPLNLILEEQSNSTYENILNSKTKLGRELNIIIVTDKYHIARSVILAKAVGFKKVYWASPETKYETKELAYHYFREMAANIAYLPKLIFHQ